MRPDYRGDFSDPAESQREDLVDEFLEINLDWFSSGGFLYRKKQEAQKLLKAWIITGKFPETADVWLKFEKMFHEFCGHMKHNGLYKEIL